MDTMEQGDVIIRPSSKVRYDVMFNVYIALKSWRKSQPNLPQSAKKRKN